jgi:hypothetical protein
MNLQIRDAHVALHISLIEYLTHLKQKFGQKSGTIHFEKDKKMSSISRL